MPQSSEANRLRAELSRALAATASLLALCIASRDAADDLSDELTVGKIAATPNQPATPYISDHADAWFDLSERAALNFNAGLTHYAATSIAKPSSIFQVGTGGSYDVSQHFTLAADAYLSPQSINVERTQIMPGTVASQAAIRAKTSSLGFALDGEYSTAGESNAESAIALCTGLTSYTTTQAIRVGPRGAARFGQPETASLLQWRTTLGFTETLYENTDLGIAASYYLYNRDPTQSGYYGATVFGRLGLGDGIPLQPLRLTVRPSVAQRLGPVRVSAYFRYGLYMDPSSSVLGGVKLQVKVVSSVRAWLSGNLQHDWLAGADDLTILWASLGARVVF